MNIVICPGIHSPELTQQFVLELRSNIPGKYLILPTKDYAPYSASEVFRWLEQQSLLAHTSLVFIAFSAGVVGGIGAAKQWQRQGGTVSHFMAFDGWGMPLKAKFPLHRVSHDYFTHWSSRLLGAGQQDFYAEPTISHLQLWRSPETCWGWQQCSLGFARRCSLVEYLANVMQS